MASSWPPQSQKLARVAATCQPAGAWGRTSDDCARQQSILGQRGAGWLAGWELAVQWRPLQAPLQSQLQADPVERLSELPAYRGGWQFGGLLARSSLAKAAVLASCGFALSRRVAGLPARLRQRRLRSACGLVGG